MGSYKILYDYPNYASFPAVGDVSRLYITNDTNTLYRWVDGAYHFFTTTSVPWGNIDGVLTNQTDLMAVLNGKQPLITAGTSAQYYRGDKTFQTLNTTAVPEGTNLYWTDARFNTGFSGKSTTNLTEGSNLYYTDARFDSRLSTKSTSNLTEGSNLYWTNARFDTRLGLKTTSDLSEGSNLYYTDERFDTRFGTKTTDNLTEGSTKLYYSSSRFNADFNNKNTDNLPEGSTNLFWTPSRSRNALTLLTVGTSGLATYNSTTGQLNIPQYQDLLVNPLVGAGAQYYVPRYSGTTSLTPGLIYDNGVYVGINRTNPFYTLDVNGTLNVEGVSIYRNLAGTGDRLVYVSSNGTLTPAIIGSGLSLASGTLTATGTASGSIGGSGTIGYIPKFSGTAALTNSAIGDNGAGIVSINALIGGNTNQTLPAGNTFSGQSITLNGSANGWALVNRNTWNINDDAFTFAGFTVNDNRVIVNRSSSSANGFAINQSYFFNNGTASQYASGFASFSAGTGNFSSFTGYKIGATGPVNNTNSYTNYFGIDMNYMPQNNVTNYYGVNISDFTGTAQSRALNLGLSAGSNKYNIYAGGTADNYLAGSLGIGTTTLTGYTVNVGKNITGATTAYGVRIQGTVQSDVTTLVSNYGSLMNTAAASFTLTDFVHHRSMQGTIGSGSAVTNQYGYFADSSMTGATNNFGFYGSIPSGSNRWNLYMNGTANNYMAGGLGIGSTSLGSINLRISKNLTGATNPVAVFSDGVIQSDATSLSYYYGTNASTVASSFTLNILSHFAAEQGTFGAGSTVTNHIGFRAHPSLIGGVNNYGFRGEIPSGTNRWNIYMGGTAQNYLAGALSIGVTTANASALLQVDSTTQGVLFPRMTTTQKNAISSPATGLVIFDTTLGKLCVYSTTWQTITSV